jgi:TolB-like protein
MGKFAGRVFPSAVLFLIVLSGSSCQLQQVPQEDKPVAPALETIVLIGFRPALSSSQTPGLMRSPISGAVFSAEPVSEEVADGLSESLFSKLTKKNGQKWVSPREAAAAFSQLASSNPTLTDRDIYVRIGKALSAEGVLGGHVYRWRDREGTDYAASRPASVAFDLYLMSAGDGVILWKARFDKTQISLSENLFDIQTFLKAKGRWMTVGELAEIGLAEMVETFSNGERGKE